MSGAISPFPVPVTLPDTTLHPEVPYKLSYLHELKKKAKKRSDELLLADRRLQRQISKHSSHVKDIDWHIKHHARILYWSNPLQKRSSKVSSRDDRGDHWLGEEAEGQSVQYGLGAVSDHAP